MSVVVCCLIFVSIVVSLLEWVGERCLVRLMVWMNFGFVVMIFVVG